MNRRWLSHTIVSAVIEVQDSADLDCFSEPNTAKYLIGLKIDRDSRSLLPIYYSFLKSLFCVSHSLIGVRKCWGIDEDNRPLADSKITAHVCNLSCARFQTLAHFE